MGMPISCLSVDQFACGGWSACPAMSLMASMCAPFFPALCQLNIIGQTLSRRSSRMFRCSTGRLRRCRGSVEPPPWRFEIGQVIETVKHPENIHPGNRYVARIHRPRCPGSWIGTALLEKHLETDIWNLFAQDPEAFPGVLTKEAHGSIKGGASHISMENNPFCASPKWCAMKSEHLSMSRVRMRRP